MTKFMFIYRNNPESQRTLTPEAMREIGAKWQSWIAEGFEKGWLLDAGNGLKTNGCVVNSKMVVTDGPFVEAKEIVGGYAIAQDSLPLYLRDYNFKDRPKIKVAMLPSQKSNRATASQPIFCEIRG